MRSPGEGSIRQRRRADGTPYWEARVSIDGRQVSFYDRSKSTAMAKARQARADAERGVTRPTDVMVDAYLRSWLETRVRGQVKPRTHEIYAGAVRVWLVPHLGRHRLSSLTPGHVQSMMAAAIAAGRSERTAQHLRAVLSVALKAAMLDLGLPRNVASLATVPRGTAPLFVPETVTPAEVRAILAAFEGHRLWPAVGFSIATGVRIGELLALRWDDVGGGTATITHSVDGQRRVSRPKSARSQRTLVLPSLARRALDAQRGVPVEYDRGLVFPAVNGGYQLANTMRDGWHRQLAAAGLPPYRWHAMRRVFAALLQDQGVPLERIRDLLGHSELRVTEGYAYTMPGRLAEDVRAIDLALNGRVAGAWGAGEGGEQPENPAPPPGFEPGTS